MSLRRKFVLMWRWSPLVTLPVTLMYALWAAATWRRFDAFRLRYDARPVDVRLRDVGQDEWNSFVRRAEQALAGRTVADVPAALSLNTVQLFVGEAELAQLRSDLPYSGYDYVKGRLMFADGLHDVRLRYRGDFMPHWGYDKKSIRVKTGTDELFAGMRAFNLIVPKFPEQVNNYLGYRLARKLGIISPRCELVNVCINGRNEGLCEFTEQLEEGTLRSWDRMPGDLYSGDLISKTAVRGSTNRVFELPMCWDKVAVNNHYPEDSRAPLQQLLELINGDLSDAGEAELSRLLDMQAFGAFGAFELLTQTHHYDEYHNWRLFWDPWALKFAPVIWDPIAWAPDMRPPPGDHVQLDMAVTRLHVWLHRNGDFLAARHEVLRDFFGNGKLEEFTKEVDWALAAARAAIAIDPNARPTDPAAIENGMVTFREFYDQVMHEVRFAHLQDLGNVRCTQPDAAGVMAFEVSGRQPVDELMLQFRAPLRDTIGATLRIRRGDEHPEFDLSGGVMVQDNLLRVPMRVVAQLEPYFTFLSNRVLRERALQCVPSYYELALAGLPADNELLAVSAVRDGVARHGDLVAKLTPSDMFWLYRPTVVRPPHRPAVWSGEILVDGVREVQGDVCIEPGTVIRMRPDAALLFRGQVTALGTVDAPIQVVPAADGQAPWGTVAINGAACSGSTFRFCRMRGGSGYKVPLEEYCAMFSIHNCTEVRVEDCHFADNYVVDDMVHVVYSSVEFDRCELVKARADALDCDISRVVVRNCRFVESDNDGVDLMTTLAVVVDCQFLKNGDKGISVGEGTHLLALRDTFDGCLKAMEAKDGSVAGAANCEIRNCQRALNAYRKNWRYDAGGTLIVAKSVFADNLEMPTADGHSQVRLYDCQSDKDVPAFYRDSGRTVTNQVTQAMCSRSKAPRERAVVPFPVELRLLEPMAGAIWRTMRADVRGPGRVD